ncbi:MAG: hypothetical protein WAM00_06160, partial [Salegentibacter sp.]
MRNNYLKLSASVRFPLLFLLVVSFQLTAQETPQDSTKTGYQLGTISLPDPASISSKYEYDPILDRYIYTEKLGDLDISIPVILTPA